MPVKLLHYLASSHYCTFPTWHAIFSLLPSGLKCPANIPYLVGKIIISQKCHILIPRTSAYVTLYGKVELRWLMELRLLISWPSGKVIILDYLGGSSAITNVLISEWGKHESQSQSLREIWKCCRTGFEDGGRGHHQRNKGTLSQLAQ